MSYKQNHMVSSFDDMIILVDNIPPRDAKDLAEYILRGFYETGWDVCWDGMDLMVSKTESL